MNLLYRVKLICLVLLRAMFLLRAEDLLPSDAPMTMMERINTVDVKEDTEEVKYQTSLGTIIGLRERSIPPVVSNTHHYAFRGIPYAKPPVDDLRFKDTVDLEGKWPGGVLNATKFRAFCPQFNVETQEVLGAEDCLYLNVYTPMIPDKNNGNNKELLPVFVFIHGGAFIRGSSSAHGAEKLVSRDLVVVTLNYRLGMLGFISMQDSILPGNYGMLDQVSALRWIQRYITEFGGDPTQVTLGGFSAGAVSAHLHMLSPLSEGLFHRALLMSGSALCCWGVQEYPQTPAKLFALKLSCPVSPSSALASCVASKDYKDIVKAQASIYRLEFAPSWLSPSVDGGLRSTPFLPDAVENLQARPTPTIFGSVPNECVMFAANALMLAEDTAQSTEDLYNRVVSEAFEPWDNPLTGPEMHKLAERYYFSDHAKVSKDILLEEFTEALNDNSFTRCLSDSADLLASSGTPVYMYMMTYRDSTSTSWAKPLYQRLRSLGYTSPLLDHGISHGDDLLRIFSFPYAKNVDVSQSDQRVSDIMLALITNFIIHGKPQTDEGLTAELPLWTPVVSGQPIGYYNINFSPSMVDRPFKYKEQNFWKNILSLVINPPETRDGSCELGGSNLEDCQYKH